MFLHKHIKIIWSSLVGKVIQIRQPVLDFCQRYLRNFSLRDGVKLILELTQSHLQWISEFPSLGWISIFEAMPRPYFPMSSSEGQIYFHHITIPRI